MTACNISSIYRKSLSGIMMIFGAWLLLMGYYWGSLVLCDIGYTIFISAGAVFLVTKVTQQACDDLLQQKDE